MIEKFNVYKELFQEINAKAKICLNCYIIGGAVLVYRGIKPATKDIDIVVTSKKEFKDLSKILYDIGFTDSKDQKGYDRFTFAIKVKRKNIRIDVFLNQVCSKFSFSQDMVKRSEEIIAYETIKILLSANEDIFAFKTITQRPGDMLDCIALAKQEINWNLIIGEINKQIKHSGQDIWITWINERLIELEEKGISIPILKETNKLSKDYYDANFTKN